MADLLFVTALFVLFGLAVALVRACERIIGPDEMAAPEPAAPELRDAA
jgi:hypothetical protein